MSSKAKLAANCIIVDVAPKSLDETKLIEIIQKNALGATILRHDYQDRKNLRSWICQLDSSEGVNYLCAELQEDHVDVNDISYSINFKECNESDLPRTWILHEEDESFTENNIKVKLSNLPDNTDEDYLELYFEELTGLDTEIQSVELSPDGSEALIEFRNKEVFDVLKEKNPLDIEGQKVFVDFIETKTITQDDPKTIEVTSNKGVITEKNAKTIKMYFSNNGRSDGGKITEWKFAADTETIHITFESTEVAKAVFQRKDHKYKETLLNVILIDEEMLRKRAEKTYEDKKPKSIRVTNLPKETDSETLELLFEDTETFGENINVVDVQLDDVTSSAIVTFAQADATEKIIQKKEIDLEGQMLHIEIADNIIRNESCTVEVTGPPDCLSQSNIAALKMYFNNKNRSGGEGVINCYFREPGLAEVTFGSSDVAKRVAEKTDHQFKSTYIQVSLKETNPESPHSDKPIKLLFSGVNQVVKEDLTLYLEDMFENVHVTQEIPCEEDSKAILVFDDIDGAKTILSNQPIHINEHWIDVAIYSDEPEKVCTIRVQGLQNIDEHKDALKMYFKNNKRSGGGPIVSCKVDSDNDVAFITFESEEVARSVVNRPKHALRGQTIEVTLHSPQESLKSTETNCNESTKKIRMTDLPNDVDKEFLELFFEDYGDSSEMRIENVDISDDRFSAVVEFQEPTDVDFILKTTPLKMKGKTVSIERYKEKEKDICTVEVHGVKDIDRNLDKVLLYFKNTKRSKGGPILHHSVDTRKNIVYITYETREVAEKVVSHDHGSQGYEVILGNDDVECKEENICTVKVHGVDKTISSDTLTYYFESKKRSGGGPISSLTRSDDDEDVSITFESSEDAKNVTGKQHSIENCIIRVHLFKPLPCYDNKVLIKGLKSTKDALFLFLEATLKVEPIKMEYHEEDEDTVLVTLKDKIDFERLESVCRDRQLEGAWLKPSRVQVSNCIFVSNIAPTVTQDTLQFYFENKMKSGGGDVEKIVMTNDENERTCMVFFEDYKVIDDITDQQHNLGKQSLSVKRFQPALGRPEGETEQRVFHVPHSIEINASTHKIQFVSKSSEFSKMFEQALINTHTTVEWPKDINQNILLHCTITKDDKNCFKMAKGWEKQARGEFMKLMDKIVLHCIDILQEIKPNVMLFLRNIRVEDETKVVVINEKDSNQIFIVGTKAVANTVAKSIEEEVKNILNEAEKERQKIAEIFSNQQPIETKMMLFQKFPHELESHFNDLKVEIVADRNEIRLRGLITSVNSAKLAIYERKSNFEIQNIDCISNLAASLLQTNESALQGKLKENSIQAVWESSADGFIVCCCKPSSCKKAVHIIRSFFIDDCIKIEKGNVPDLETQKWREKVDKIEAKYPGRVKILLNDDITSIQICSLADEHKSVKEEVQSFLRDNTIITQVMPKIGQKQRFLEKHCRNAVEEISRKLQEHFVKIKYLDHYRGLEIQGLHKGVEDAMMQIKMLLRGIRQETHTVKNFGIAEHILSPKGKDTIHTIEHSLQCIICVEGEGGHGQMTNIIPGVKSQTTFQGTTMYVWQGDMTELDVDVLVNPSDRNLGSSGGLGKAIHAKGGPVIKYECERFIHANGTLNDGEVFISNAGDLKAKNIAHIKSQQWEPGKDMDKDLESTVFMCFQKTANIHKRSIAIPAIGCGINRYPVTIATTCIVKALKRALMEYQDSSLEEIYLCDMNESNVDAFTEALCSLFGRSDVDLHNDGDINCGSLETHSSHMGAIPKNYRRPTARNTDGVKSSQFALSIKEQKDVIMGNIAVTIVKGEIAKQKVDMIVNTTSQNLDLRNGAVSISLYKAAGQGLQDEVTAMFPKGLENKTIAVTSGHKLNCRFVVHTSLPNFIDKNPQESINNLHKVVKKCLQEAQRKNCHSIAFPAFGTGNLGYPRDVVAKEMFKAVEIFQKKFPKSAVQDVRFIVYQMDIQTLTAFEEEKTRLQKGLHSMSFAGHPGQIGRSLDEDVPTVSCGTSQGTSGNYTFDSITVIVKNGDILEEKVDCIVNITNVDLNLNIGEVSKCLMNKGGLGLQEEIENHKVEMKKNKIVTTLAPGLPFGHIIHIDKGSKDTAALVKMCLTEAENEKMTSIAMPAFGTSNLNFGTKSNGASQVAKNMFKAVREFSKTQPKFVKEVRFVIFQNDLLQEFFKTEAESSGDSTGFLGNLFKGLKNTLGFAGSNDEIVGAEANSETDYNSVSFIIIAMKDDIIRKAIKRIEQSIEKEIHTKVIEDHIICNLEDNQIDEINGIALQCHIQMTMDKNKGFIQLSGIVNNVMNASDKINLQLRDAERMEYMKDTVQWSYIEVTQTGEKVKAYAKDLNMIIEKAYKRQKETVEYVLDGTDYILDFALMEEYPESDQSDKVKVVRRDLVKGGTFELPAHWDDMHGGNLRVVSLPSGSQEFQEIEKRFKESAGKFKDTNGQTHDWTIDKIERVQNKTLWEQYQSKKKQLEEENPQDVTNERELWHGTSADPVDSINAHGFNRSFCGKNATVYGDGVYFAIDAKYSCQNTYSRPDSNGIKRMYLCKVLTGEYAKGERGMRVPPPNPKRGPQALFNSVTNDLNKPHMFIIFHDTQACPEYLIYFKEP